jgi:hypothetical protein
MLVILAKRNQCRGHPPFRPNEPNAGMPGIWPNEPNVSGYAIRFRHWPERSPGGIRPQPAPVITRFRLSVRPDKGSGTPTKCIDFFLHTYYKRVSRSMRGRVLEAILKTERDLASCGRGS